MKFYNHFKIEKKWQTLWDKKGVFRVAEPHGMDAEQCGKVADRPKYYVLDMFPYPSGAGLHVGHPKGYIATDVIARMKMMRGFNVLHPMGWDAFGLPAENYALQNKIHPAEAVKKNIITFKKQLDLLGFTYDWDREINTTDPAYYKWTQWIFLQMFKKGLAYESFAPINWCPSCQTGLANEDLEEGKCERCGSAVEQKPMRQWVLKITDYAERLLNDLDKLKQWPEAIKEMQKNWIGKSVGAAINFKVVFKNEDGLKDGDNLKDNQHFSQNDADQSAENTEQNAELAENKTELLYEDLTYKIRGAIFNVKKKVGLGHKENVYYNALKIEFKKQGLSFESEKQIDVIYEEKKVGVYQPDFIIENKILIELKALPKVGRQQLNQIWTYLKGSNYKLALLVNYGGSELEIKRIVYDTARISTSAFSASVPQLSAIPTSASVPQGSATSIIEVFTTRPDTLFGATYCVIAPEHELVAKLQPEISNWQEVSIYIEGAKHKTALERTDLAKNKTGIELKGIKAINPVNGEELPIFVADYILSDYGTGAVMCVPAHDSRDYEFAVKYNLPIKKVVMPLEAVENQKSQPKDDPPLAEKLKNGNSKIQNESDKANENEGISVNSDFLDGLPTKEAKEKMVKWLEDNKLGERKVNYKLRDWVFSRQRFWGEPIPLVKCEKCGWVPLPEEELPLELPKVKSYAISGTGESPLAAIEKWVNTKCPKCEGPAKRETNTMPQWGGSCWYYLAYAMLGNQKSKIKNQKYEWNKEKINYWNPVDFYVGGAEHATRHLIYARFWHKFLFDIGAVNYDEPFTRLQNVGLILAEDGRKMSKRWGNVIIPDDIVKKYGADTMRVYEMFMGPFNQPCAWSTNGLVGAKRFLDKVWAMQWKVKSEKLKATDKITRLTYQTIKKVTEDIEAMRFNTAIAKMMELVNEMNKESAVSIINYKLLISVLSPFAPHICEELWSEMGGEGILAQAVWPKYDEKLAAPETTVIVVQVNGRVRENIEFQAVEINEEAVKDAALSSQSVKKYIDGHEIKKIIYIKNRLINIVV